MDDLLVALTAFILIVPVELPDKTFIATLLLTTRHPPLAVWVGVVVAFFIQCVVAVGAGRVVGLLPQTPVRLVAAGLFAAGAIILLRQARRPNPEEEEEEEEESVPEYQVGGQGRPALRGAVTSFLVLFAAEWGDLSQLLTAGLVASGKPAIPVFVGSWVGLAVVAGVAVLVGRLLLRYLNLVLLRYLAAGVCAVLAILTALSAL
jgi:putative Ca2+/H+ antiporter (TMEM165/GDT1 family)